MENGNITGCEDVHFEDDKSIDNRLEISVGFNSNVVVKFINLNTGECIRKIFINKGSNYSIRHIPEGKYYLKIAYGNDWEIPEGESKCDGQFMSDAIFKKSDEILDFNFQNGINGIEVPSYTLTLNTFTSDGQNDGNKFNTDIISANDF